MSDNVVFLVFIAAILGLVLLVGVADGVRHLFAFVAERIRRKDVRADMELREQLSRERAQAMNLRALEVEHGLPITPLVILDQPEMLVEPDDREE